MCFCAKPYTARGTVQKERERAGGLTGPSGAALMPKQTKAKGTSANERQKGPLSPAHAAALATRPGASGDSMQFATRKLCVVRCHAPTRTPLLRASEARLASSRITAGPRPIQSVGWLVWLLFPHTHRGTRHPCRSRFRLVGRGW